MCFPRFWRCLSPAPLAQAKLRLTDRAPGRLSDGFGCANTIETHRGARQPQDPHGPHLARGRLSPGDTVTADDTRVERARLRLLALGYFLDARLSMIKASAEGRC